jgi:hypothetical protein
MAEQPARARKPVEQPQPETPGSIRRLYWYSGAVLGVLAGVLIAAFVVPPIFDRYFGVADIALGDSYDGNVAELRVTGLDVSYDGSENLDRFEIVLTVDRSEGWCPSASDFRLELEGNVTLGGATLDPAPGCVAGESEVAEGRLAVSFDGRGHAADAMHILHLSDPEVRFWLKEGEPGE